MSIPLLMLEIHTQALEQERRNMQLHDEQMRIARLQRRNPIRMALLNVRQDLGTMLIRIGERLSPKPTNPAGFPDNAMSA